MFRSLPRTLGFIALILGVAALLFPSDATGQFGQGWVNGNHVPKNKPAKEFPPIFDKGFRPGFGIGPAIVSPRAKPAPRQLLGKEGHQGNGGGNLGLGGGGGLGGGNLGLGGGGGGLGGGNFGLGGGGNFGLGGGGN